MNKLAFIILLLTYGLFCSAQQDSIIDSLSVSPTQSPSIQLNRTNNKEFIKKGDFVKDSIYLLAANTPKEDIGMHLSFFRSQALKSTIEILAFERQNISAIHYMNKWYKGECYHKINEAYFAILDSNIVQYSIPATKKIISNLIDLKDEKTLRKLGGWLKNNREKWVELNGIDPILDKSWEVRDSIQWGQQRYPYLSEELEFILGAWVVLSGWTIEGYKDLQDDRIVFTRPNKKDTENLRINVSKGGSSAVTFWGEKDDIGTKDMISCPIIDTKSMRISFGAQEWNWYDIIVEKNQLVFVKQD